MAFSQMSDDDFTNSNSFQNKKRYKSKKDKKLALNSQLQTVQILRNVVQVLILCLSYFIPTIILAQFWKLNVLDNTLESKNGEEFFFFANKLQITPLDGDADLYVIETVDDTTQVLGLENDETAKGILLKFLSSAHMKAAC